MVQSNSQGLQTELRVALEEKSHGTAELRPQIQNFPIKASESPRKEKAAREKNIRYCPLRCTTVMAGSTTAQRITVIQQFAGASPMLAGWEPAGLAALLSSHCGGIATSVLQK